MSLSSIKTRLRDLQKRLDVAAMETAPQIKFITLQPGEALPPGKTESDFDFLVRLHDEQHPRPNAPGWMTHS